MTTGAVTASTQLQPAGLLTRARSTGQCGILYGGRLALPGVAGFARRQTPDGRRQTRIDRLVNGGTWLSGGHYIIHDCWCVSAKHGSERAASVTAAATVPAGAGSAVTAS